MEEHWLILARSYGFSESLEDFTKANLERRRKFHERLRANTRPAPETRADQIPRPVPIVESTDDWEELHKISTLLIPEGNLDALYNRILDAAMGLMSSDMASMQSLDPERNRLRLLAWKGVSSAISHLLGMGSSRFRLFLWVSIVRRVSRGGAGH
jgi:hypothetical protein